MKFHSDNKYAECLLTPCATKCRFWRWWLGERLKIFIVSDGIRPRKRLLNEYFVELAMWSIEWDKVGEMFISTSFQLILFAVERRNRRSNDFLSFWSTNIRQFLYIIHLGSYIGWLAGCQSLNHASAKHIMQQTKHIYLEKPCHLIVFTTRWMKKLHRIYKQKGESQHWQDEQTQMHFINKRKWNSRSSPTS